MSTKDSSDQVDAFDALRDAMHQIEQCTVRFPISQLVAPLADTFDWLLDEDSVEERWLRKRQAFEVRFGERWRAVSNRALGQGARQVSDRALLDSSYDPLGGTRSWGIELTRVFRAALAEVDLAKEEAPRVLPGSERMRAFARVTKMQNGKYVLPVMSYGPLLESEWNAVLDKLNDIVELALRFEGAVVVWLVGGFFRDLDGRLKLNPQVSLPPPTHGTRVKPLYILLGTAYEEQCPTLIPLVRDVRAAEERPSDELLAKPSWDRVVVQIDVSVPDYQLFNLERLGEAEREIARRVLYLDQEPREAHVLKGQVHEVPRPWKRLVPEPKVPKDAVLETRILTPQAALEAAREPPVAAAPVEPQDAAGLHRDAEELRRKGMATVATNPAIAQKYLLASTVLENNSVDVWLMLVEIATSDKQKESFRQEAEKVLRRQHRVK